MKFPRNTRFCAIHSTLRRSPPFFSCCDLPDGRRAFATPGIPLQLPVAGDLPGTDKSKRIRRG